ncbi:MAG: lipoate--protein ligase family protein [Phormidesmis sp.]
MPESWRLIPLYEGTGAEQMAMDSWLLNQHVKGLQPPCLRFYTWRSPTLSLGYHQRQFPAHWHNLRWQGQSVPLVRRPTGGRAVLHQGDLTYALITSGLKGSRRDVYRELCQFLIEGWHSLGIALFFGEAGRGYSRNPNCFGTATAADLIMEDGYKLIGSAQVHRENCVLQHGSMRLCPDGELFEKVFGERVLPPDFSADWQIASDFGKITAALVQAAEESFEVGFEVRSLSPAELNAALTSRPIALEQPLS